MTSTKTLTSKNGTTIEIVHVPDSPINHTINMIGTKDGGFMAVMDGRTMADNIEMLTEVLQAYKDWSLELAREIADRSIVGKKK